MMIRNMFAEDINRQINGVIKVDQDTTDVIEQEVREYVITKELKKHFISFFDYYSDSFDKPTDDIGVWISGFFGSSKSHFLKMLSYILENKSVGGVPTVEMFRKKFADDPATFMLIDKATRGKTETILFNIDIEGSINKDKTAVLRVFAKMFYNHLGFFGENLKVAMLEQYIDQLGKTEEFRRVFEAKKGKSWVDQRKAFAFNGKFIIPTLMEVLDMSEEDAKRWFNDKTAVEFSIAQLVEDIKAYVVDIVNMAHLGARAFEEIGGEVVQTTAFVIRKSHIADYKGEYCRLIEPTSQQGKENMFLDGENRYNTDQSNFSKIPGSPVAYWVSAGLLSAFATGKSLGDIALARNGMKTGENGRFVRLWWEVILQGFNST